MTRPDADRLTDIRGSIARCTAYRQYLDFPDLGQMTYDAILRNLAVIGEAVKSLSDDFKQQHLGLRWPAIAGLRNVVVHEYFRIDPELIRDVVDGHLVPLLDDLG